MGRLPSGFFPCGTAHVAALQLLAERVRVRGWKIAKPEGEVCVCCAAGSRKIVRTNACILATSIIVLLRSLDPRCSITRISCRPCRWRPSLLPIACCIASFTSLDLICSCSRLRRLGRNTPMHRGFFSPRRHRPLRLRWRGLH